MDWDSVQKEHMKNFKRKLNLKTYGLKVFEIINEGKWIDISNDMKKASSKYLDVCGGEKNKPLSYKVRQITIRVKHWTGRPFNGGLALVDLSESVWHQIMEQSMMIKRFGYELGQYIVYWKPNHNRVWFAFMTKEQYKTYKQLIGAYNYQDKDVTEALKDEICWCGYGMPFRLEKFRRYYGNV